MLYVLNYVTAIYVLAAILPAFFLLRYVYRHDTIEKEPPALLALMLGGGLLATFAALILETVGENILGVFFRFITSSSPLSSWPVWKRGPSCSF